MEKKKVVPTWVSVILLMLCAVCVAGIIFFLSDDKRIPAVISSVLFLCAIFMAVIYCFMGYRKNAAKIFTVFSIIVALAVLFQITHYYTATKQPVNEQMVSSGSESIAAMPQGETPEDLGFKDSIKEMVKIIIPVLIFGMLSTLTLAKDLGKKKSYILVGSCVILSLINYLIGSIRIHNNVLDLGIFKVSGNEFSIFVLCVIYGIMTYAKYQDKAARGTK